MNRKVRYFYAAALLLAAAVALTIASSAAAQNGLPPLIDREIFFGNPEIASTNLARRQVHAFRKPHRTR